MHPTAALPPASPHIGSTLAGTHDVTLDAGRDINILAATSTSTFSSYTHTTENGFMSNGGMSFTYGSRETTDKFDSTQSMQSQNRSLVGSTSGNLTLKAGRNALISGSDIVAGNDINIAARDITINSGLDNSTSRQEHDQKQSGLTVAVSVGAVSTAQTVNQMGQAFSQSKNDRTKALALMAGGMAAMNGMSGMKDVSASATVGSSESHSDTTQTSTKNSSSKINAGGNLNLVATAENGQGGNITIRGSDIKAGRDMTLAADNNIALLADQDTSSQVSHNSSSSSGAGVSVSNTTGPGVTANASMSRGNSDGHDVTNINTHLDAGNTLRIKSGNDTTLKGATVSGKQVVADIGGNLSIESLQDTSTYNSKQESASASVTVGMSGGSGSFSANESHANGNYASVVEQSGLKAGDGGFQVNVKGNTNLKGALIESSAKAAEENLNTLSTATLTTSDIQNKAEASASSTGINLSSDMATQGKYGVAKGVIGNLLNNASDSGSSAGQTRTAISAGAVTITNDAKQKALTGKDAKETIANLNHDTANAQTAAQKQDVQAMVQTVEAERAIKAEAIKQVTTVTDLVYKQQNAPKKVLLQTCDEGGQNCTHSTVKPEDAKVGADQRIHVFNNGIGNNEAQTLANAAKQSSDAANAQGVYVVVNPHTGNPLAELFTAAWDKTLAPVFGISNASEANIDIMNAAARQGGVVDSVSHSRGTLTESNALIAASERYPSGSLPIGIIQLNGSAANAQNMANLVNTMTNGSGLVMESTHVSDIVGTLIGGNAPTGGMTRRTDTNGSEWTTHVIDLNPPGAGGEPMSFLKAHSSYAGNLPPELNAAGKQNDIRTLTNQAWGTGTINTPVVVAPTNNAGRR